MIKKLFLLILLAAGGLFFRSAYVSTAKFRDALEAKDVKTVNEMVDWPSLQASMKDQMRELTKNFLKGRFGSKVVESPEFDRELDAQLAVTLPKLDASYLVRDAKKRLGKPDAKELVIDSRSWSPVREFKMKFADDPTTMRFRFIGSEWKLVALEMNSDEAQKVFNTQFAEAMQASRAGAARPAAVRR